MPAGSEAAVDRLDPVRAWKRAQVLLHPAWRELRFAGPVHHSHPYRPDDVFRCARGHRRVEPDCSCGFYAVPDAGELPPSIVVTALLEVELEGRVVVHRECLRGERQRVRTVTFDGWCAFCVHEAQVLAGVRPAWRELPPPWLRAVPVCGGHRPQFGVQVTPVTASLLTGVTVRWDRSAESRAARSLRRLYDARGVLR